MLDQATSLTSPLAPPLHCVEQADDLLDRLQELIAGLESISTPIEGEFVSIGKSLAEALGVLNNLQSSFSDLSGRLDGDLAFQAEQSFLEAIRQSGTLAAASEATAEFLARIDVAANSSSQKVSSMRVVFNEVGALAINAKIEAAQVDDLSIDFNVFTNEIGQLYALAEEAVDLIAGRLDTLLVSISAARKAEDVFQRNQEDELEAVRLRLEGGVEAFADRRKRSRGMMGTIGEKSQQIARRVGECISQMQISDLTRQRIEHVRESLELLCFMLDPSLEGDHGHDWTRDLDHDRQMALVSAVCRLQAEQLSRAVQEFSEEVERMKANLQALSEDAALAMEEASNLFSRTQSGGSFLADLQRDADEISGILADHSAANARVRDTVKGVLAGFEATVKDLDRIHSIDADMRIMGLNASFKCARLGAKGSALGVVAQELRGCSRRTQDISGDIWTSIQTARQSAEGLEGRVEEERARASDLEETIRGSMQALGDLGASIHQVLDSRLEDCARVSKTLGRTSDAISIHRDMEDASKRAEEDLVGLIGEIEVDPGLEGLVQGDVQRLLEARYTMASERMIHGLVDDGPAMSGPSEDDGDIDDIFL